MSALSVGCAFFFTIFFFANGIINHVEYAQLKNNYKYNDMALVNITSTPLLNTVSGNLEYKSGEIECNQVIHTLDSVTLFSSREELVYAARFAMERVVGKTYPIVYYKKESRCIYDFDLSEKIRNYQYYYIYYIFGCVAFLVQVFICVLEIESRRRDPIGYRQVPIIN